MRKALALTCVVMTLLAGCSNPQGKDSPETTSRAVFETPTPRPEATTDPSEISVPDTADQTPQYRDDARECVVRVVEAMAGGDDQTDLSDCVVGDAVGVSAQVIAERAADNDKYDRTTNSVVHASAIADDSARVVKDNLVSVRVQTWTGPRNSSDRPVLTDDYTNLRTWFATVTDDGKVDQVFMPGQLPQDI
ncbi:hypothetical protein [Actinomyces vulturis]|uniref:hypothetical protein n=1 Tax=Actinomyces vulturis TaxID=1857645 RepID=UPI00082DFD3A|nr:hypothetical protein [Actinomyces vulturis]